MKHFSYRMGAPVWRLAARAGVPLKLRVDIHRDEQSQSYWADSPDLDGLVVASQTLDELRSEVLSAAALLMAHQAHATRSLP